MNGIQVFNNPAFGEIRTAGTPEKPLFCLADVCKVVELTNPSSVKSRLEDEDVQLIDLHALNGGQEIVGNHIATFVTESGFYEVILFSGSPKVKPFRKWVTRDVLPTIRKTGGYIATNAEMSDEEIMSRALEIAHRTIERKNAELKELESKNAEQQRIIAAKDNTIAERDRKIEKDAPKVVFSDAVVGSKSSCLIGELAKILTQNGYKIGQNRLFDKLREEGYLGRSGEYYNIPNQKYVEQGLFELKKTTHSENGVMKSSVTPKVTGKGQQYFINKYLKGITTISFND